MENLKIKEVEKKLKSAEIFYNNLAKENHFNKKLATDTLAKIKKYKAELVGLTA